MDLADDDGRASLPGGRDAAGRGRARAARRSRCRRPRRRPSRTSRPAARACTIVPFVSWRALHSSAGNVALAQRRDGALEPLEEDVQRRPRGRRFDRRDRVSDVIESASSAGKSVARPVDVDADADHRARHRRVPEAVRLAEHAGELAHVAAARGRRDEVVRPLEPDRAGAERRGDLRRLGHGERHDRAEPPGVAELEPARPEADGDQQRRARRRRPGAAVPAAALRLHVGDRDADLGRAVAQPARDDVVRRADDVEPLEARQPARAPVDGSPMRASARARQPARGSAASASTGSGRSSSNAPCSAVERVRELRLADDAGDPDLGGRDHLDVHARVGERPEHPRRVARRVVQARADDRDLGDASGRWSMPRAPISATTGASTFSARASSTRGTVNEMSVAPSWPTFWTIMSTITPGVRERPEHRPGDARPVRHGEQRDLRDVAVVGQAPDLVALLHERILPDQRTRRVLERAEDLDLDVVDPAQLDRADLHDLGALLRELEHLLVADHVELAGVRHEARVGGVDAADVGEDLAAIGAQRGGERDGRRVRAAPPERRRLAGLARPGRRLPPRRARRRPSRPSGPGSRRRSPRCRCRARARTRRGSTFAMRARPCDASVVIPACAPVSEIAFTPSAWSAIETSVALWCSPVARSMSSSRGVGLVGDRGGEGEELVGRVAHRRDDDHEVRAGRARPRDPLGDAPDPVRLGQRRAPELLHDELNRLSELPLGRGSYRTPCGARTHATPTYARPAAHASGHVHQP